MKICKRCGILYGDIVGICSKCGDPLVDVYGNASASQKAPTPQAPPKPEAVSPLPLTVMKERKPHEDLNTRKQAKEKPTKRTGEKKPTKRTGAPAVLKKTSRTRQAEQVAEDTPTQTAPPQETVRQQPPAVKAPERVKAEPQVPAPREAVVERKPVVEVEQPPIEDVHTPFVEQVPVEPTFEPEPVPDVRDVARREPDVTETERVSEPAVVEEPPRPAYAKQPEDAHVERVVKQTSHVEPHEPHERPSEPSEQPRESYEEPQVAYEPPREASQQPREPYRQPQDAHQQQREASLQPQDAYRQQRDAYQQVRETYQQPREAYQQPQEAYRQQQREVSQQPQDAYRQPREAYQQPREAYQQPREASQQPRNAYQQPQDAYRQTQEAYRQQREVPQQPQGAYRQARETYQQQRQAYQQPQQTNEEPYVASEEPETPAPQVAQSTGELERLREQAMWESLSASEKVDPDFVEDSFDPSLMDATETKICPNCGSVNRARARVCVGCGANLQGVGKDDAQPEHELHVGLSRKKEDKGLDALIDKFKEFWAPVIAVLVIIITLCAGVSAIFLVRGVYKPNSGDEGTGETEQVYIPVQDGGVPGEGQAGQGVSDASFTNAGLHSNMSAIVNGGYVCYGDATHIYYSVPTNLSDWSTYQIVCADRVGNNIQDIYTGPHDTRTINHLCMLENYLVFSQVTTNGSSVMAVRVDGSEKIELDTCDTYTLCQVDNGWVYYLKNGSIWRCDIKGENKTELAYIGSANNWRVWGEKVYFYASDSAYLIYEADLDGDRQEVIYYPSDNHAIKNAYPVADRRLVVFETDWSGTDGNVVYVNLDAEEPADGGNEYSEGEEDENASEEVVQEVPKRTLVSGLEIKRVCSDDEGIYYTVQGPGTTYRIGYVGFDGRAIGPEREIDNKGEVRYNCVLPEVNTLYYGVVTDTLECTFHGMDGIHGPVASIGEPFLVMLGRNLEGQA